MRNIQKGLSLLLAMLLVLGTLGAAAPTQALAAEAEEATFERAMLQIDGLCWNFAYDEEGGVRVWYYDEEQDLEVEKTEDNFPAGVSYDLDTNTLTLDNASLTSLELGYQWIEDDNGEPTGNTDLWLPNADLKIVLVGENTIGFTEVSYLEDGTVDPGVTALTLSWGVQATLTGSGSLYLNTAASNEGEWYAYPLQMNSGSGLTLADSVSVTATVSGQWDGWEDWDEDGNFLGYVQAELAAVGSNHWMAERGNTLTVQDSATLTLNGDRAMEFHNADSITVTGGTLNANGSVLMEQWDDDLDGRGAFTVSGGEVNVDTREKIGQDAIRLNQTDLTVSGGSLTVQSAGTEPYLAKYEDDSWWEVAQGARAIVVECGSTMTISGGTVDVDFTNGDGISLGCDQETANAFTQTGGTVTVESTEEEGSANALRVDGTEHSGGNIAEFRGGTTVLKGTLGMDLSGSVRTYPGVVNLREGADVTVNTTEKAYEYLHNWGVISLGGGELNVYGGELTVNAENSGCINVNWDGVQNGSYTQTGGTVSLTSRYARGVGIWQYDEETGEGSGTNLQALNMETGDVTVSGGTLNIESDYEGLVVGAYENGYDEDGYTIWNGGRFTLTGGNVNIRAKEIGVWTYWNGHVDLRGGSMNVESVLTAEEAAGDYAGEYPIGFWSSTWGAYVYEPYNSLTVTGGTHSFIASQLGGRLDAVDEDGEYTYEPFSAGIWTRNTASFQGGSVTAGGDYAVLSECFAQAENMVTLGGGMHAVSEGGAELTMVGDVAEGYREMLIYKQTAGEDTETEEDDVWEFDGYDPVDDRWYTFTENSQQSGPLCTRVTISPTAGTTEPEATLSLENTSGQATAGAPVSFKAVVTGRGQLTVSLPNGVEYLEGSFSLDGALVTPTVSGSEIKIDLDGNPHVIRFQVTAEPTVDTPHVIIASLSVGGGTYTSNASFSVSPFNAAAPTVTKVTKVPVSGNAAPGWTVSVTATSKKTGKEETVTGTVTSLGTFAVEVELPVENAAQKEEFDITVTVKPVTRSLRESGASVTLPCTYDPDSVTVQRLTIINKVHYKGDVVDVTTTVENGKGSQSFYTYWPDEPDFSFAVEFEVPEGFEIVQAVVEVIRMSGQKVYVPLEKPGPGDHNRWKGEGEFWNDPPVRYRVAWQVAPEGEDVELLDYGNLLYGQPARYLPIMDPSGVVYDGSEEDPVAGAAVTLYFGGDGETADEANAYVFDMTPYGQVNPQLTNELGQYGWNVPSGWWKIVAAYEKDGKTYTVESEWMHVLPVQEGVNLNLNLSSGEPVTPVLPVYPVTPGTTTTKPAETKPAMPFRDVSGWYSDDVAYVYEKGMMTGVSDTRFDPNGTLTRAMVVTMLHRLEGEPSAKAAAFTDVARGKWYTAAIDWASETGLVAGYNSETFGPDDPVTREQLAAILYRYAGWKGQDVSGRASLGGFSDGAQVSAYAADAMEWAVDAGILNGSGGKLLPQGKATRAEAAAMFHRFLED